MVMRCDFFCRCDVLIASIMCTQAVQEKPVWRLAFFSRLEERKGLKIFVKAVAQLLAAAAPADLDERFEVYFVGSDSRIDMRPSTEWLRAKTASWT